jgi:hypothetical protein
VTHKITDIVAFIRRMRKDNPAEEFEQSKERLCARFPGLTYGQLRHAFEVYDHEIDEEYAQHLREYAAHKKLHALISHLFERFPEGKTVNEVVALGVACGDPAALQLQAAWNTKASRLHEALGLAAMRAHPQWLEPEENHFEWTGALPMPTEAAMVDWFQMTYPAKAREIEQEIVGGAAT